MMSVTVTAAIALVSVALGWMLHLVRSREAMARLHAEVRDLESRLDDSMEDSPVLRDWNTSIASIQRRLPR